jgi:hypothetical protein
MDELGRAERPERVRHELALAIAVHGANGWAREGLTSFVNGRADGGVEGRDAALDRSVGIRLQLDELDEDEARVLVDGKDDVAVAADGEHQLLEVVVKHARLRSRRGERAGVRRSADAGGGAGGARARARRGGGGGEDFGSVNRRVRRVANLVHAEVRATVEKLGGLCGGEASDVGGGADAMEPKSPIGGDGDGWR